MSFSNNLPFTVEYSSTPNTQINCQNNLNVIPNGPIFPSKPIFPSALPPSLSGYPTTLQTNFLNVKRQATICNLRTSNLIIDSGSQGNTYLQIKNLPLVKNISDTKYYNLVIDENGKTFKNPIKININNSVTSFIKENNTSSNNEMISDNISFRIQDPIDDAFNIE